ncbi:MAG: ABC transporter substrate-binding protein [Vicinamibacterales bacterium]
MDDHKGYWQRNLRARRSRRGFLSASATLAVGGAAMGLVGCGDDDDDAPSSPATGATAAGSASAAASSAAQPKTGGTLKVSFPADITSIDGAYSGSSQDVMPLRVLADTLISYDQKSQLVPLLATSWETPDPTTWVFKLRNGVKYHDGTAFDAAGAKVFLDNTRSTTSGSTQASDLAIITGVDATDATTLTLKLSAPFAPLASTLYGRAGMFVSPASMQKYGKDTATKGASAGPYKLDTFTTGSALKLVKHTEYWNPSKQYLDGITFQIIKDPTTALTNLSTGDIDVLSTLNINFVDQVSSNSSLALLQLDGGQRSGFEFQITKPPFDNENLRRAVLFALGLDDVNSVVYKGKGKLLTPNFWWPYGWAFYNDGEPFKKDLTKAKQLLSAGGKPDGFEFKNMNYSVIPEFDVMRANLAKVGIKMVDDTTDIGTFSTRNRAKQWDAWYGSARTAAGAMDPGYWVRRYMWSKGVFSTNGYTDDALDAAMIKAEETTKVEERTPLYGQVNTAWHSHAVSVYTLFSPSFAGIRKNVNGAYFHPSGWPYLNEAWKA